MQPGAGDVAEKNVGRAEHAMPRMDAARGIEAQGDVGGAGGVGVGGIVGSGLRRWSRTGHRLDREGDMFLEFLMHRV